MKSIRYTRYNGEDLGLSAEDLLKALADFFLGSGYDNPYMRFGEMNANTMEDLKQALERALRIEEVIDGRLLVDPRRPQAGGMLRVAAPSARFTALPMEAPARCANSRRGSRHGAEPRN